MQDEEGDHACNIIVLTWTHGVFEKGVLILPNIIYGEFFHFHFRWKLFVQDDELLLFPVMRLSGGGADFQ